MMKPFPFGKFLLLDRLNTGGMAEVFLAKVFGRQDQDRIVAIKRILPSLLNDQEFVGMFLDEARVAVQLDHRNLVRIFELGRLEDNYYIAMEYLSGCDLRRAIDRSRKRQLPLSLQHVLYIVGELAAGLDHAHRARDRSGASLEVVHRDVSPQNVVLTSAGAIKLIDFGIAKVATRQQATQVGILKGKFGYMSPEQARGTPLDRRSDIFSLGIIFHELLTGRRLFAGETEFAVLERVRKADVPPPRRINAAIPEEVERIVLKALALDPADRYPWASELIADLRSLPGRESTASAGASGGAALATWMGEALAEELRLERERLRAFEEIPRPPELAPVSLDTFAGARRSSAEDEGGTLVAARPGLEEGEFQAAATTLMTNLPLGFSVGPSRTDLIDLAVSKPAPRVSNRADRWEDTTRPPRPMHLWIAESPPPHDPVPGGQRPFAAAKVSSRHALRLGIGLTVVFGAAALLVGAGESIRRAFPSTGSLAVTARPFADLQVEVDNRPLALNQEGSGLAHNLRPGSHFVRAEGPLGQRAMRVTVVAGETTSVELTFSPPPVQPPDPVLAHNRE